MAHLTGGVGDSSGEQLGIITEQIGKPLLKINEGSVRTYGVDATDDAGDGTVEGDMNATDFTSQVGTTYVEVLPPDIMTVVHKLVAYLYTGPRNVRIGVGGGYTSLAEDYTALGTADHSLLDNLAALNQHPQDAITDLLTDQATQDQNLVDHETAPDPHTQYVLNTEALATFVGAGYGGVIRDTGQNMGLLSGWRAIEFNVAELPTPRYVTQDVINFGVVLTTGGIWRYSLGCTLHHNEAQGSRTMDVRVWNLTDTVVASRVVPVGIARNTTVTSFEFSGLIDSSNAGLINKILQAQISSVDVVTDVIIDSGGFSFNHVGEASALTI